MSSITTHAGDAGHGDGHHDHPAHLAHHFDTPEQQYASGKLGMWVFLGTELLMFGGLFCAYAVYRHNHPEVFAYAHTYLDKWWGALNTVILLISSFTMAWGVRAAQLGQRGLLCVLLALTLLGGAGFMVIKSIEYNAKWKHHLFPGRVNMFNAGYAGDAKSDVEHAEASHEGSHSSTAPHDDHGAGKTDIASPRSESPAEPHATPKVDAVAHSSGTNPTIPVADPHAAVVGPLNPTFFHDPNAGGSDAAKIVPRSNGPAGVSEERASDHRAHITFAELAPRDQVRVNTFFSIYFMMTGLHGVHVLVGMGLILWVLVKGASGIFGPQYYTPVDLVGLYWHLVDLIWIFLFPLLYLIH